MKKILITGAAGFIGARLSALLDDNYDIIGIDNLNAYYEVGLKEARLKILEEKTNFRFMKIDLTDKSRILNLFKEENFDVVIHLGA